MILKQKEAAELIAGELRLSARHVYDRYFHLPNFPGPILIKSATGRRPAKRWDEQDVRQWVEAQLTQHI